MKLKLLFAALLCTIGSWAQRQEYNLKEWRFSHNGESWEKVTIPHDWAIAGPFDKKWDLQKVAIEQNGETEATEKSGRSGALPWIGEGVYETVAVVPEGFNHGELVFQGAMAEPEVYINDKKAGEWKYGYNAFKVDVTPWLKQKQLRIRVNLRNIEESSRWYPGAGLYRPVKLVLTAPKKRKQWIDDWSTFISTTSLTPASATLTMETKVMGYDKKKPVKVLFNLTDNNGTPIKHVTAEVAADGTCKATMTVTAPKDVEKINAWTPETPYLYSMETMLYEEGKATSDGRNIKIFDKISHRIGLRTISVSAENGFQLNGKSRKLQGVCLHHDLGPLGAAENRSAFIRQIRIMKNMGCDAIRTAHNMPSQWQMEICDSMGMMVMAESFDMWVYPKCKNGYARFFKEWSDRDITNLVVSHRNHPAIVMWSIGNEIPEQWSQEGKEMAQHLQELIHSLDNTRPVTQGMDRPDDALKSGFAQVMDVPGFNYRVHKYDNNIKQLPKGFLLGSETASTVSSRGVYKFPVVIDDNSRFASYSPNYDPKALDNADGQCSSYDVEYCPWSNLPDDDFLMMDDRTWTIGQFVWTGFDYLGEPSPYDEYWPSRSSYFGICDLAGLPKDRYYLYRSQWNKKEHTLHVLPHWTWTGREGEITPVYVYTDYPEAELFVNGKSQGRRHKDATASQILCNPDAKDTNDKVLNRYRLRWNDVKYEPGELRVVAYDSNGTKTEERIVRTAGSPEQLCLTADRTTLCANGDELAFVTVEMTDGKGILCPDADDQLEFEVSGNGTFRAVCNGDATSLEPFTQPTMRLFHGKLVVVAQASTEPGTMTLTVSCPQRGIRKSINIDVVK